MSDLPPPPPPPGYLPPPPPPPGSYGSTPPPGYTTTYGETTSPVLEYAGVGARFGAILLDGIITTIFFVPAIIAIIAGPKRLTTCSVDDEGNIDFGGVENSICEVPTGGAIATAILLGLLALAGILLYHSRMIGSTGQTIGKKATGVKVVDAATGLPIGTGRALGRYLFAMFISGNLCALGYLWALWDNRKQTWHDKVVSTVVVRA